MSLWKWFCKGLYGENTRHVPLPARDPRPKGAQKGVVCRDHERLPSITDHAGQAWTPFFDRTKPLQPIRPLPGFGRYKGRSR